MYNYKVNAVRACLIFHAYGKIQMKNFLNKYYDDAVANIPQKMLQNRGTQQKGLIDIL